MVLNMPWYCCYIVLWDMTYLNPCKCKVFIVSALYIPPFARRCHTGLRLTHIKIIWLLRNQGYADLLCTDCLYIAYTRLHTGIESLL